MTAVALPLRFAGVAIQQGALGGALIAALALTAVNEEVRTALRNALRTPQAKIIALMFMCWGVTLPFSINPLGSLEIGGRTALFTLAVVVLGSTISQYPFTHRTLWKWLISISTTLTILTIMLVLNSQYPIFTPIKNILEFDNPRIAFKAFAAAAMCLIPVVVWAGRRLDGPWRWWAYLFAPLTLTVMVQTHNRSALAGFLAMTVVGVFLLTLAQRKHAKALLATTLAGVSGIVAWVTTKEINSRIIETAEGREEHLATTFLPYWLLDPHRQNIWSYSFDRFLEHPWVGNGIDQLNRLPGANLPVPGLESFAALVPSHPHNWAVEVLAETGLLGFTAMLLTLVFLAWHLIKSYLLSGDEAPLALVMVMAGFWTSALFNFSIWAVWWQLVFLVSFMIVASTNPTPAHQPASKAHP